MGHRTETAKMDGTKYAEKNPKPKRAPLRFIICIFVAKQLIIIPVRQCDVMIHAVSVVICWPKN